MFIIVKVCRYYKDKCFVCNNFGFFFSDFLGEEKNNEEKFYGLMKVKLYYNFFYDIGYKYKIYEKSVSNDIMKECDSEDSNLEIVFICDISYDNIINK